MDVIASFAARYERTREEELSLEDYLQECKRNRLAYASAAEGNTLSITGTAYGDGVHLPVEYS